MKHETLPDDIDPVLTMKQVVAVVTYSRSQLYKMMKAQRFIQPIKLGPGRVGWRRSAVANWLSDREEESAQLAQRASSEA